MRLGISGALAPGIVPLIIIIIIIIIIIGSLFVEQVFSSTTHDRTGF